MTTQPIQITTQLTQTTNIVVLPQNAMTIQNTIQV